MESEMPAHCEKPQRITLVYRKEGQLYEQMFDDWEAVATFINEHSFEGRNIPIIAWEYHDDKQ